MNMRILLLILACGSVSITNCHRLFFFNMNFWLSSLTILVFLIPHSFAARFPYSGYDALVAQLNSETCLIHLIGLEQEQVMEIGNRIAMPVIVTQSEVTVQRQLRKWHCHAYVTNMDGTRSIGNGKIALRIYIIATEEDSKLISQQRFKNPVLIFRPILKDMTLLSTRCHATEETKVTNMWHNGWLRDDSLNICTISPLKDQHLNVSASILPPYSINTGNSVQGIDSEILATIAHKMQFTFKVSAESMFGAEINKSSGSWSGVIGKVMNESSQMGIGNIALNENRQRVVDFLQVLYPIDSYLVAIKPRPYLSYWNVLKPFSVIVWFCILASLIAATLILSRISLLTSGMDGEHADITVTIFTAYSILLQQHFVMKSGRASVRFGYGIWHIVTFFFAASYLCNLRSFLMEVEYEKPMDSEEDVINLNRRLFLPSGAVFVDLFATSPIESQQKIYKTIKANNQFYILEKGYIPKALEAEIVRKGDVTLNTRERALASLGEAEKRYGYRPFRLGRKAIFHLNAGFVVPKNTFWKSEMNGVILQLIEGGIIAKLLNKYIPGKYLVDEAVDMTPVPFELSHFVGAIIILCVGIVVSSAVFVFECNGLSFGRN